MYELRERLCGDADLPSDAPVSGTYQQQADDFAHWVASQSDTLHGAVLQHEFQWEGAAHTGAITDFGRV